MLYKVELSKSFTKDRRNRAGISVTRTEPFEGDLTDEQVDAIQTDPEFVLTVVEGEKPAAPAKKAAKAKK